MNLIDKYDYQDKGYNPFLIGSKWQIAYLNYNESESLEKIDCLDIHYKTDEVFVLLEGQAVLIAATVQNGNVVYDVVNMQPSVTYNIPVNVWHKIAMYEGAKVLIVEDSNTHLGDFEFYYLNDKQIEDMRVKVDESLKKRL